MAKLYAQEQIRVNGKDIEPGGVVATLPDGLSLQQLVTFATTGTVGEEPPAKISKPAKAAPPAPPAVPADSTAGKTGK